ncbi:hypothetical protein JMJ55_08035 [Belnapia sp. T6]|uniref:Uncharacterized protein n=1 Tax=Belnapia mucosa TaxID=2804532 RepID=A0ABS1V0N9_9PROT|nr:hypothetical protein [Belnapia mucosa]MBL6455268.1 hypothetical protein [Belnapia mucosa]
MAERHVREGEARVARQERLIANLERDNHPERAIVGRQVLANLRWSQELSRGHLERLRGTAG